MKRQITKDKACREYLEQGLDLLEGHFKVPLSECGIHVELCHRSKGNERVKDKHGSCTEAGRNAKVRRDHREARFEKRSKWAFRSPRGIFEVVLEVEVHECSLYCA